MWYVPLEDAERLKQVLYCVIVFSIRHGRLNRKYKI
jgi:hypothetical protein